MAKHVRYSQSPDTHPAALDTDPAVHYGISGVNIPEGVRVLPPCTPTKIVCIGRNYVDHAKELGNPVPSEPLIFLKPPSSLIGSGDAIVYPSITESVHFEGELGIIIGERARNVPRERAFDYIRGYTCVNDVTARDIQKKDVQFTRGKGFDTFCPVGPCMVDRNDVDLATVRVRTIVNGVVKQDSPLSDLIFPIDVIIAFVTQCMTLEPGDLIATGTPPGVGPMLPGDTVQVEVTGVGILHNTVTRG